MALLPWVVSPPVVLEGVLAWPPSACVARLLAAVLAAALPLVMVLVVVRVDVVVDVDVLVVVVAETLPHSQMWSDVPPPSLSQLSYLPRAATLVWL